MGGNGGVVVGKEENDFERGKPWLKEESDIERGKPWSKKENDFERGKLL